MYKTAIFYLYYRKNGNCVRDQCAQKPILISEEELHSLYSSLNITSKNEIGKANDIKNGQHFSENMQENHLRNIHLDVSTIFKCSF
jgi:hypothetical protein